ncbi:MAG: 23S rRNA pseudouridine synthase [bacterium P3]|nr:MAG: 23S rRNA pseudouridine synthase [bacterium P3]KWW42001.1 MAG: 23S rRNA pseudouridine synthase [bacterium F083]
MSNNRKVTEKQVTPKGRRASGRAADDNANGSAARPRAAKPRATMPRDTKSRAPKPREATNRPQSKSKVSDTEEMRLNKYIAHAGICSRREADVLIAAGGVSVNGKVVTEMGYKVQPGDVVNYGGETLRSEPLRYFLLNKPKGYITTVDDPQERKTVMMLIDGACTERIYPVGRLDRATTGLLLFTNDGELARKLTHPSSRVYKVYQVELDRPLVAADMRQIRDGVELDDGPIQVDDIQYVEGLNDKRILGVQLHSGRNRIVRRIFEHLGYEVRKLDRVAFAGLTKKDLPRGRYRELTAKEVGFLRMI